MTTLTGPERPAASGDADSLVIFLHGYGADGNDLIGLAEPLAPYLPGTRFLAPNAPERCANNPMGYQWLPIPWLDGSSQVDATASMFRAFDTLGAWLDHVAAEVMPPERTVVIGFSQGTMMALQVLPRRAPPVAGLVGFSGRLLNPDRLATEIVSRLPMLLVHGDADPMVPVSSLPEAASALRAAGVPVETHVSPDVGHGIAPDGLSLALAFARARLGVSDAAKS